MVSDSCGPAGCNILIMFQAFELLTGRSAQGDSDVTVDDKYLAAMHKLTTGQTFLLSILGRSELRDEFFNNDDENVLF
jgi:hypothetical protein